MEEHYYRILGLQKGASLEDIKKAYKKYAAKYHPDSHGGDDFFKERFQEIKEAFDFLIKNHAQPIRENEDFLVSKGEERIKQPEKRQRKEQRKRKNWRNLKVIGIIGVLIMLLIVITYLYNLAINNKKVAVTGVQLNHSELITTVGDSVITLTAIVQPANATNKNVVWFSTDPKIASIDAEGKITVVNAGTVTISVMTEEGYYFAECSVTVNHVFSQGFPNNANLHSGARHSFSLAPAIGGCSPVTYQWQQSRDNSIWTPADGENTNVNYTTSALTANTYYRRQATDACSTTIYSAVACNN